METWIATNKSAKNENEMTKPNCKFKELFVNYPLFLTSNNEGYFKRNVNDEICQYSLPASNETVQIGEEKKLEL